MFPSIVDERVVIDLETDGLSFKTNEIFGVAFCFLDDPHGTAAYWDIRDYPRCIE